MDCDYQDYLKQGGLTGLISAARQAECLKGHLKHHAAGTAVCSAFRRRPPRSASACRVCGAVGCANPACFRTLLIQHRLAEHAQAAARDAAGRRNGHGSR